MKWYWCCPCGSKMLECDVQATFCLISICYKCGASNVLANRQNVYSLVERFTAFIHNQELHTCSIPSITEAEDIAAWRKDHPSK